MDFKTDELEFVKNYYKKYYKGNDRLHISSNFAIYRYIRHVDVIEKYLKRGKKILDWGSGIGHVSLILKNRKYNVTAFDIGEKLSVFDKMNIKYIKGNDKLPFASGSFDAIISCGVLEHVTNDMNSLKEIKRVLTKSGYFFIFNLPNEHSISEFIGRHSKIGGHSHIYSKKEIVEKLRKSGFEIIKIKYSHILPTHVAVLNMNKVLNFYNKNYKAATNLDMFLESVWPINIFSNEWLIVAKKI